MADEGPDVRPCTLKDCTRGLIVDGHRFRPVRMYSSGEQEWRCVRAGQTGCDVNFSTFPSPDPARPIICDTDGAHNHERKYCDQKVNKIMIDGQPGIRLLAKAYKKFGEYMDKGTSLEAWKCVSDSCFATIYTIDNGTTIVNEKEPWHWCLQSLNRDF